MIYSQSNWLGRSICIRKCSLHKIEIHSKTLIILNMVLIAVTISICDIFCPVEPTSPETQLFTLVRSLSNLQHNCGVPLHPFLSVAWPLRDETFPMTVLDIWSHQGGHSQAENIPFTPGASLLPWLFIIPLLLPLPSGSQMFLKKKGHRASRTLRRQAYQIGEHRF